MSKNLSQEIIEQQEKKLAIQHRDERVEKLEERVLELERLLAGNDMDYELSYALHPAQASGRKTTGKQGT